ncbi:MAG: CDP-glycerol glycerophosphotransferase family protein [Chlamydiota bacterium]
MTFSYSTQCCGLIYGNQPHHLDHLATLCACFDIPLILTDQELEQQAKHYYPQLVIFCFSSLEAPQKILQNYDIILTTMPYDLFDSCFFLAKKLINKSPMTIWCPHGNSDKGHSIFFMEALNKEKAVFVYGEKMLDFLKEKNALQANCSITAIGNYRYEFYQTHQGFYNKLTKQEILSKFTKNQSTYLYAPTWNDYEKTSSFHLACPHLLETLPDNINLIVKLHPNTLLAEDMHVKKLIWKYESAPNIVFLEHFPLIYPLLDVVDLYIGDTSSIGYDFLTFNKPLFFLNIQDPIPNHYLYQCGNILQKEDFPAIYSKIQEHLLTDQLLFSKKRKETYTYTFSKHEPFDKILLQLCHLYKHHHAQ